MKYKLNEIVNECLTDVPIHNKVTQRDMKRVKSHRRVYSERKLHAKLTHEWQE